MVTANRKGAGALKIINELFEPFSEVAPTAARLIG
jgi:hypothetical protein